MRMNRSCFKVFKLFAENNINFKQVTTSEISILYNLCLIGKKHNVLCKALIYKFRYTIQKI